MDGSTQGHQPKAELTKPAYGTLGGARRMEGRRMTFGRMMDFPLGIAHLIGRAETYFGPTEVVSTLPDRTRRRATYGAIAQRCRKLAASLEKLGVGSGERVATLCW